LPLKSCSKDLKRKKLSRSIVKKRQASRKPAQDFWKNLKINSNNVEKMVKEWRDKPVSNSFESITSSGLSGIEQTEGKISTDWDDKITYGEMKKEPAGKYVKTLQRWCDRFVAESYSYYKDIEKEKIKSSFKIVEEKVRGASKPFDVNDIINLVDGKNITDGSLQRRALNIFVCLGRLKNNITKIKDKAGKEKIKYVFVPTNKPICPNLLNKKCCFDWKGGAVTDFFPPEYKQDEEESENYGEN
jgi:hypothetical protein